MKETAGCSMLIKILKIVAMMILVSAMVDCSKDLLTPPEPVVDDPLPQDTIPRLPEDELYNVLSDYYSRSNHCALGILGYIDVPGYKTWKIAMGYFDDSRIRRINTNDKFILGSVSKTFTATIILQLMEEGLINLDAPVIHYLPGRVDILEEEYDLSNITVRQLLNHESGIADFIDIPAFTNQMIAQPANMINQFDILSYIIQYRDPLFAPGTSFEYSSTNYLLLGIMAEYIGGKPFYLLLKEKICLKIGLESTHLHSYDPAEGEIAHGYYGTLDGSIIHGSYGWTAGMIVTTIKELGKFLRALASGELFQDQSTFELMITPGQYSTYGLGIFEVDFAGENCYGHTGKAFGYRARMFFNPEKDAVLCIGITTYGIQELPNENITPALFDILP